MPAVIARVAQWLGAWSRLTRTQAATTAELLEKALFTPVQQLRGHLPDTDAYEAWLRRRCEALPDGLPCVAAHNDLTMWNVLLDSRDGFAVVDWREASEHALPLTDMAYAALDAVVLAGRVDRQPAFMACFTPDGLYWRQTRDALLQLAEAVEMPAPWMDICIHACFLAHAANESMQSEQDGHKHFLPIAEWLATHRDDVQGWWSR